MILADYRLARSSGRAGVTTVVGFMLLIPVCGTVNATVPATIEKTPASQDAGRVAALIQQLGAPQYTTRERAQVELEQLGLEAFDALNQAQSSDDIEIAMRARYLVRSMQVHWSRDDDSVAVKQILNLYGSQPEDKRRLLMQQLATLGSAESLKPLCRLVKYEQSQRLSRRAALLIIQADLPETERERHALAEKIKTEIKSSKRAAADWLRAYSTMYDGGETSLAQWDPIIARELELLNRAEQDSSRTVVRDLLWWYSEQLQQAGQQQRATEVMRQSVQLLDGSPQELLAAVDWFRAKEAWGFVLETATRFPAPFGRSPLLLYRLADAQLKLGRREESEQTAKKAERAVPEEAREHLMAAANLQHDGLFHWARREYVHVIGQRQDEPLEAVTASFLMSEMLHDMGQHEDAGKTLEELVAAIESNQDLRKSLETDMGRTIGSMKSRMNYFYARHAEQQNLAKKQRDLLASAIASDPIDADVLIAMFRLPHADEPWKKRTQQLIQEAAKQFRSKVTELDKMFRSGRPDQQVLAKGPLATACNQLAWLIANTEGDAAEAIRMSLRSLALRPNTAGYLDTLGHCYYANGDYADAVAAQMKAAVLEPHSPQIIAKLKLFKKALEQHPPRAAKKPNEK